MTSINNTSGTLYRIHTDRLGVPRKASTTTGAMVRVVPMSADGAGDTVNIIGAGPRMGRRYAGQYWDEESYVINNGYRSIYNGMYTSPDPLHMQTQSRYLGPAVYTYAANRPQVYQDPDGRIIPGLIAACALGACEAAAAAAEVTLLWIGRAVAAGAAAELIDMIGESTATMPMPTPPPENSEAALATAAAFAAAAAAATAVNTCSVDASCDARTKACYDLQLSPVKIPRGDPRRRVWGAQGDVCSACETKCRQTGRWPAFAEFGNCPSP